MRWYVIRTLLRKECYRLLANKGGITLMLLLVVGVDADVVFRSETQVRAANLTAGVRLCYVDYADETELLRHLRRNVPIELRDKVKFRRLDSVAHNADGTLLYPQNTGAIQLRRPCLSDPQGPGMLVWFWHPGADGSALAPFEAWFWKETLSFYIAKQQQPSAGWSGGSASEISAAGTDRSHPSRPRVRS